MGSEEQTTLKGCSPAPINDHQSFLTDPWLFFQREHIIKESDTNQHTEEMRTHAKNLSQLLFDLDSLNQTGKNIIKQKHCISSKIMWGSD